GRRCREDGLPGLAFSWKGILLHLMDLTRRTGQRSFDGHAELGRLRELMRRKLRSPAAERPSFNPSIIPQCEIEQRPQKKRIVRLTGSLLIKQMFDVGVIKEVSAPEGGFHNRVFDHGSESIQHPLADGNSKALLFSLKHAVRNFAL